MRRIRTFVLRLCGLFRKERRDLDLAEEIESHLQLHIADNLRSGMSPEEARRQALLQFGGIESVKEGYREQRGLLWLERSVQDVRYASRALRRNPAFTSVAILTLALGIGANTAIFSVVDAAILRPLPYQDADRVVSIRTSPLGGETRRTVSLPVFVSWKEQARSFVAMAASRGDTQVLTAPGEPEQVRVRSVTSDFFTLLGTETLFGRTFAVDAQPDKALVAILSYRQWQRCFGGKTDALGQTIILNNQSFTLIGILPPTFRDPADYGSGEPTDIWLPIVVQTDRMARFPVYQVLARLRSDLDLRQGQTEMNRLSAQLDELDRQAAGAAILVMPLHELVTENVRPRLLLLLGAVWFLLLIACANVANLLLARAANRDSEMALRAALGASRGRLVRLVLTESFFLSLLGAALGLLFAIWGLKAMTPLVPAGVPRLDETGLDYRLLLFATALAFITSIAFGLAPALRASQTNLGRSLKEGLPLSLGRHRHRLTQSLAIAEIAVALVLLVGGGLMLKSFWLLSHIDPGFEVDQVLTFRLRLPAGTRTEPRQRLAFYQQLLEEIKAAPHVRSAGIAALLPLSGSSFGQAFAIEGAPLPASPESASSAEWNLVSSGYFQALGLRLLRGRDFTEQDILENREVIIVSESMARRYWPNRDAVGKRLRFAPFDEDQPWTEIIGVVGDVKHQGLDKEDVPQYYSPYSSLPPPMATLAVRHSTQPASIIPVVRDRIRSLNSDVPVDRILTMEQVLSLSIVQPRFYASLLALFAALGLLLAAVGIYGILHYAAARRTREFGLRMALGASTDDLLRLMLRQALGVTVPGLAFGLMLSGMLTRLLKSELFDVSPVDPWILGEVSILLAVAAMTASYVPARRAARVDPLKALRYE